MAQTQLHAGDISVETKTQATLHFLGAAGTMSGSCYLVEAVGRAQGVMLQLARLRQRGEVPDISVYLNSPIIIISASGMLTGGRVLHHLVAFGQDARNAILLSGYQTGGTRGATRKPRIAYATHGDPDASDALRGRIKHELGWNARVPEHLERVALEESQ